MSADRETSHTEPESEQVHQGLAFLHQAREVVRSLEPAQLENIHRRLNGRRHHPRRVILVPALAALGLVLVTGATFAVAKGSLRSLPIVGPLFAPPSSTDTSKFAQHRRPAVAKPAVENPPVANAVVPPAVVFPGVAPLVAPAVQPTPAPAPSEPAAHSTRPAEPRLRTLALRDPGDLSRGARVAQAPAMPAPLPAQNNRDEEENPIVAESRSFASVIEPWHRTRNASAALALLDAHEGRYPSGSMRLESRVLRAEIYLAQGRESDALSVLDALSLSGLPRARELHTVRGELRIKAGRCADGKRDLDDVLEKGVADALAKRAAQAIAHCP